MGPEEAVETGEKRLHTTSLLPEAGNRPARFTVRAGILLIEPVRLFDINPWLQEDPRAATTHPATLEIMGKAGLADDMARVGLVAPVFQFWDRPAQRLVATFDHALLEGEVPSFQPPR